MQLALPTLRPSRPHSNSYFPYARPPLPPSPLRLSFTSPILSIPSTPSLTPDTSPNMSPDSSPGTPSPIALFPPNAYYLAAQAAQHSQGRRADLRKEVAIKAHVSKQVERRARFLSRVSSQSPQPAPSPSPRYVSTPATPPLSPAVFYYSLPSPGLMSPLTYLDSLNLDLDEDDMDEGGDQVERAQGRGRVRREEVDFRALALAQRAASAPLRTPPTLSQITERLHPSVSPSLRPTSYPPSALAPTTPEPRPRLHMRKLMHLSSTSPMPSPDDFPRSPSPPTPSNYTRSSGTEPTEPSTAFSLSSLPLSLDLRVDISPSPLASPITDPESASPFAPLRSPGAWPDSPYPHTPKHVPALALDTRALPAPACPSMSTPILTLTPASTPTPTTASTIKLTRTPTALQSAILRNSIATVSLSPVDASSTSPLQPPALPFARTRPPSPKARLALGGGPRGPRDRRAAANMLNVLARRRGNSISGIEELEG